MSDLQQIFMFRCQEIRFAAADRLGLDGKILIGNVHYDAEIARIASELCNGIGGEFDMIANETFTQGVVPVETDQILVAGDLQSFGRVLTRSLVDHDIGIFAFVVQCLVIQHRC